MRWAAILLAALSCAQADTYLVAVGIEQYDDPGITAVPYAERDAAGIVETFRQAGVPAERIVRLTSAATEPHAKPTRNNLVAALDRVRGLAGPDDTFVLFFAGHGLERDGQQYLLTSDTRERFVADTALPLDLANRVLQGLQAGQVLFLIDACRNDPTAARGGQDAALTDGLARGLRPRFERSETARPAVVATLLACDIGQRAWADPHREHGVFTAALLESLGGEAAGADGQVMLRRLFERVVARVRAWSERNGRTQRPVLLAPDGADMPLLRQAGDPRVTVEAKQAPLRDVVARLSQQTGIPLRLGDGVDAARPITWTVAEQPLSLVLKLLFGEQYDVVRDGGGYAILSPTAARPAGATRPTAPPAAIPPATPGKPGRLGEVRDSTGLDSFLSDASYCTLWLRLPLTDLRREPTQRLKDWVRAGHRMVVENDAAQTFGFTTSQDGDLARMVLGVKPDAHPLIRGVEAVQIANTWGGGGCWFTTGVPGGTSLLVDDQDGRRAYLAVVAYGAGEVIFRGDLRLGDAGDKGALESNWDEYLLHFPQGTAGGQPALEVAGKVGEINHPNAVSQYTQDPSYIALIVHCDREMFERMPAAGNALGEWVRAGHRMVVENDTATAFGFTVEIDGLAEQFVTSMKPDSHPLIYGVRAIRVRNDWQLPLWVCKGHPQGVAMIVERETGKSAYLAMAPYGLGEIIFRPRNELSNELDKGAFQRSFEEYLASPVVPWGAGQ